MAQHIIAPKLALLRIEEPPAPRGRDGGQAAETGRAPGRSLVKAMTFDDAGPFNGALSPKRSIRAVGTMQPSERGHEQAANDEVAFYAVGTGHSGMREMLAQTQRWLRVEWTRQVVHRAAGRTQGARLQALCAHYRDALYGRVPQKGSNDD